MPVFEASTNRLWLRKPATAVHLSLNLLRRVKRRLVEGSASSSKYVSVLDDFMQPSFPIDLVYTWVDGHDPAHVAKVGSHISDPGMVDPRGFTDHQELRYSLRSVAEFLPWIRRIYIVTDDQRPAWLAEHPKVTVVDHTEILASEYLPTFNSHVIESALHRIPGVAEHFIYLNDDVLFARPMKPADFFTAGGLAYSFAARQQLPDDHGGRPSLAAQLNGIRMTQRHFPNTYRHRFKHTYYPLRRSVLQDAERLFGTEFDALRKRRFRSVEDFASATALHGLLAYGTGRGLVRHNRSHYIAVRSKAAGQLLDLVLAEKGTNDARQSLCVNDASVGGENPDYADVLARFFEAYYPRASPFETI